MDAGTLYRAAWVIDGSGRPGDGPGAVLVRNGRIAEVLRGEAAIRRAAAGAEVVSLEGRTLLPGLIDAHVHLCLPGDGTPFPRIVAEPRGVIEAIALRNAAVALRAGITTLRDCGGFPDVLYALRRAISLGYARGPRLVLAGWPLTITGGHCHYFGGEADGPDTLRGRVREAIKGGADYIKAMGTGGGTPGTEAWRPSYSREEVAALVDEAHRFGRRATLHCLCAEALRYAVDAGADEIQHAWFMTGPDSPQALDPGVADAIARAEIPVCPTLGVGRHLRQAVAAMSAPSPDDETAVLRWERVEAEVLDIAGALRSRGVRFVAGSDAGWRFSPFDALLTDLELMAAVGCSPLECIHAATGAAADALGVGHETGMLREGLAADLIAVWGRPDQDLGALRRIDRVILADVPVWSSPVAEGEGRRSPSAESAWNP